MKVAKTNTYREKNVDEDDNTFAKGQLARLDQDVLTLFTALQGRIRFGTGTSGDRGENISGEFVTFTTSATPDEENTIAHTIGSVPTGYIVLGRDKLGLLYQLSDTGTAWTGSNIYLKCNIASVTYKLFLLK